MISALVVDAEVPVCDNLCQLLGLLGVSPRPAYNLRAACMALDSNPPELLFLSDELPDEGAASVMKHLSSHSRMRNVRIIHLSTSAGKYLKKREAVLYRPANPEAVEKCLHHLGVS